MKTIKKLTALLLAVIMLVSVAGCSSKAEWSYKSDDKELAIGVYIYSLYTAYSQASELAKKIEGYDGSASFLNLEIQDEDDENPLVAREWIKQRADEICMRMLAVEAECKKHNVTISAEDMANIAKSAKSDWTLGPYYQYYASMGYSSTPYEQVFYPLGVSYESFEYAYYTTSELQYQLFTTLYGEGGAKEVPADELKKYFTDNYTNYSYFTVDLTTTEKDDNDQTKTVALDKDAKKEMLDAMNDYIAPVNSGETAWADMIKQYMKDDKIENDPSVSRAEIMENSSLPDDVKKKLEGLKDGKAAVVETGSDTSAKLYIIYKAPIADAVKEYIEDENNSVNVLVSYKQEDFEDYMDVATAELSVSKNTSVLNKYQPKMFE